MKPHSGFQIKNVTIFLTCVLGGSVMPKSMKGRLTQPLVRENGSHRPATWDEAMERVVTPVDGVKFILRASNRL